MSSNQQERRVDGLTEKVIVAVKASREISKTALVWALTHVVQPGDCIILLVVVPPCSSGRRLWVFPRFSTDCASANRSSQFGTILEQKSDITDSCSKMLLQLKDVYDPNKTNIKIKVLSGSPYGAVAVESMRVQSNWVVLDKHLKHEEKHCIRKLQCNIAVMKRSHPKVLRLNLLESHKINPQLLCDSDKNTIGNKDSPKSIKGPSVTPTTASSPDVDASFTATEAWTPSASSSDPGTSPFLVTVFAETKDHASAEGIRNADMTTLKGNLTPARSQFQPWTAEVLGIGCPSPNVTHHKSPEPDTKSHTTTAKALSDKFSKLDREAGINSLRYRSDLDFSVREAISVSRKTPGPPPLCSICQHKTPVFGKPPKWFSYSELELATGGFSQENFLAEGGFGSVHRGVLSDGQAIAVKQHKLASSQGDHEFCSEVEVLSCAQHRNVVMLIGFCVEDRRRLLVYEYVCNGSLDTHLYGQERDPLEWAARQKIAVGAARGLRYLHEECRVGCIVHRDMRPNNILLTHDFEPMVGDFGLARWQPHGDLGVETRVIGTIGYLAPEYAQSGQITEKADVFSFGVVLLELVTGRKAVDVNQPKGNQCLTEWARPLLDESAAIEELIDRRLGSLYSEHELKCMLHAASLCINREPDFRPRMSQVLRILEGDMVMDSSCASTPICANGSVSRRMWLEQQQQPQQDEQQQKQQLQQDEQQQQPQHDEQQQQLQQDEQQQQPQEEQQHQPQQEEQDEQQPQQPQQEEQEEQQKQQQPQQSP
ncbi:inactive protein kinase SELMODRAFT_444075-like [Curcuma longa]|uniref:inactive protein kinase SELMODRAFT_444075-like n=1 Tax=Curcuma longa TaxID=136217 RepID=UPI003D9E3873